MFEVPTHKHINFINCRNCDMLAVGFAGCTYNLFGNIAVSQNFCFLRQFDSLDLFLRIVVQMVANIPWGTKKFGIKSSDTTKIISPFSTFLKKAMVASSNSLS